jgi:hypothetical protein
VAGAGVVVGAGGGHARIVPQGRQSV